LIFLSPTVVSSISKSDFSSAAPPSPPAGAAATATGAAAVTPAVGDGGAAEEKSDFDIELTTVGDKKINKEKDLSLILIKIHFMKILIQIKICQIWMPNKTNIKLISLKI
jgi:hypothetical protein